MSSSGYFTTPRCDEAASFRSGVNSASSAQRIQRCCSGVLRDRTHLRRAKLASFPTVTGMASASRGSHHSCGPSCSVCASDRVRPRCTMSWRTRSGKNPRRLFGGLNPSRLRASARRGRTAGLQRSHSGPAGCGSIELGANGSRFRPDVQASGWSSEFAGASRAALFAALVSGQSGGADGISVSEPPARSQASATAA